MLTRARITLGTGIAAIGFLLVAACSAGGNSPSTSNSAGNSQSPAANGSGTGSQSAQQALVDAATHTAHVTSARESISVQSGGTTTNGTLALQLKPKLRISEDLNLTAAGHRTKVQAIMTTSAMYLHEAALTKQLGKPWVKINLSALGGAGAASLGQLFHSIQSNTFANQAELLTVAKNARVVGTQTIDGVSTTEYAGSFPASQALKLMGAKFRKVFSQELSVLGNSTISFKEWIDGQHFMRKMVEVETVSGQTVSTTLVVTAINKPVHISLPPASQTASPPGL
jgi:hypothetical protein